MSHGSTTAELPSGTASKAARSGAGLAFRPFGTHEAQLLGRLLVAQYGGVQSTDVPAADITPRLYTSEAVFEDPMIHVSGLPNIQAQFNTLRAFFASPVIRMLGDPQIRTNSSDDVNVLVTLQCNYRWPVVGKQVTLKIDASCDMTAVQPDSEDGRTALVRSQDGSTAWRVRHHGDVWPEQPAEEEMGMLRKAYHTALRPMLGIASSWSFRAGAAAGGMVEKLRPAQQE